MTKSVSAPTLADAMPSAHRMIVELDRASVNLPRPAAPAGGITDGKHPPSATVKSALVPAVESSAPSAPTPAAPTPAAAEAAAAGANDAASVVATAAQQALEKTLRETAAMLGVATSPPVSPAKVAAPSSAGAEETLWISAQSLQLDKLIALLGCESAVNQPHGSGRLQAHSVASARAAFEAKIVLATAEATKVAGNNQLRRSPTLATRKAPLDAVKLRAGLLSTETITLIRDHNHQSYGFGLGHAESGEHAVCHVAENGLAHRATLHVGDVLISANGAAVSAADDHDSVVDLIVAGLSANLVVRRRKSHKPSLKVLPNLKVRYKEEAVVATTIESDASPVSVVVGPMDVIDFSKAGELLRALQAVRDGSIQEGRASEYDLYITDMQGSICNEKTRTSLNPAGPYFLREVYPSLAAQIEHGKHSAALASFRKIKGLLANPLDPNRAVDIPRATVNQGDVVSEEAFMVTYTAAIAKLSPTFSIDCLSIDGKALTAEEIAKEAALAASGISDPLLIKNPAAAVDVADAEVGLNGKSIVWPTDVPRAACVAATPGDALSTSAEVGLNGKSIVWP